MRDGEIVVKSIVPGGPAEEDGRLSPEDRILAVGQGADGTPVSVAGAVLRDVLNLIRGDAGTTVKLGVEKPDGRHDEYKIVRGEVQLPGLTTQIVSTRSTDGERACRIGVVMTCSICRLYGHHSSAFWPFSKYNGRNYTEALEAFRRTAEFTPDGSPGMFVAACLAGSSV